MGEIEATQDPSQVQVGRPARVTVVEDDGKTFHARIQGGGAARVASSELVAVKPGDTVLINETGWQTMRTTLGLVISAMSSMCVTSCDPGCDPAATWSVSAGRGGYPRLGGLAR